MNTKEASWLNFSINVGDDHVITVYSIMLVVILLLATIVVLRLVKRLFTNLVKRKKVETGSGQSIFQIIKYIIWTLIIIFSLEVLGFKVSLLLASVAALLVGVGLGLQQLFNDIASGIVLLIEQSIKVDDIIEVDNGMIGKVVHIGIRTSQVKTRDDIMTIIPNSLMVNNRIINWSLHDTSTRFNVSVGVAYGSDVQQVKKLLLKAADMHQEVSTSPAPFVRFIDFGDSSLDFQLFFWLKNPYYIENVKSDLRFEINRLFSESEIQIPFPQRDVHIKNIPSGMDLK